MTRIACLILFLAAPAAAADRPIASTYDQRQASSKALTALALACHYYHDVHGHFPADVCDAAGKPLLSWRVALLPFLDNDFLHAAFKLDEPWDGPTNRKLVAHMPKAFANPHLKLAKGDTYFQGFDGPAAGFTANKKIGVVDFTDGTSNTILLAEAGPAVPWTKPGGLAYETKKPLPKMNGPYADRFFTVFADGSARALTWNMDETTYRRLIERGDGNAISTDGWDPPVAKPETPDDRKTAERLRKILAGRADYRNRLTTDRKDVLERLDRTGGAPPAADIPPDADIETLQKELDRVGRIEQAMSEENERLRAIMAKRVKK